MAKGGFREKGTCVDVSSSHNIESEIGGNGRYFLWG